MTVPPVLREHVLRTIAHAVRTPAGVIRGSLSELNQVESGVAERQSALFAMAERAIRKLLILADRLTLTAQLPATDGGGSGLSLHKHKLELNPLLCSTFEEVLGLHRRRAVDLRIDVPEEPVHVEADPTLLSVALFELLASSLRRAKSVAVLQLRVEGQLATIALLDDGGLPGESERDELLEPFASSTKRGDVGLGIALASRVLVAHGAELGISVVGDADVEELTPADAGPNGIMVRRRYRTALVRAGGDDKSATA